MRNNIFLLLAAVASRKLVEDEPPVALGGEGPLDAAAEEPLPEDAPAAEEPAPAEPAAEEPTPEGGVAAPEEEELPENFNKAWILEKTIHDP